MSVVIESDIKQVYINKIVIGDRKRIAKNYESLKQSISEIGLMNPVLLTTDLRLIAGAHRIAAYKELGHKTIPARIVEIDELRAELAEIDENIVRNQLTELEESIQLARRKEIYEALYPETSIDGRAKKAADARWNNAYRQNGDKHTGIPNSLYRERFTENTAKQTGRKERTIQRKVQIGSTLSSMADEIQGSAIEDSQKDLIALAQIRKKSGEDVAKEVLSIAKETDGKKSIKSALAEYKKSKILSAPKQAPVDLIDLRFGDLFDIVDSIEDQSIDLLNTDPPYMVLGDDWDQFESKESFLDFTERWLKLVMPKAKKTGRVYISFSQWYQYDFYKILERNNFFGFIFKQNIIWYYKNNNQPSNRKEYRYNYEPIFYLYGPDASELNFTHDTYGETQQNVWEISTPQSNYKEGKLHSAQKPIELYKRIIKTGSREGDLVLDCFAGSGTTGLVCKQENRRCILIEKDSDNIEVIKARVYGMA